MQLTRAAIQRPLFILMVIGAIVVMGLVAWTKLGVDLLPAMDIPVVTVSTVYPGASPDAVNTLVTKPVEDAVAGMSNIDHIQATSTEGSSLVIIFFTDQSPVDASVDVERRVNGIVNQLPQGVKAPTVGKYDPNSQPILYVAMSSSSRDLGQLQRLAESDVQKPLQASDGVAVVNFIGGLEREIQVQVNQQKLQARGLSILQVNQALAGDNLDAPAGSITQLGKDWSVRVVDQAQTPAELNDIMVASTPNGPVFLKDVATVVDTYKKVSTVQRLNGHSTLGITIVKQANANTVSTADAVKGTLAHLQQTLPPDVHFTVVSDASTFTRSSINDVQRELMQAVLLTGLVLLLFLHTFRSTLIVLLAIPTSLVATLGVMYFLGFSLNMMSLMGLTLTVGILVDDSIVVLENIFRHLQLGEEPRQAALNGRSEIGFAAIAITLVDVVVFTPIAFMTGIVGQYFRQFGLVIVAATLFSLFVSFTLTPMLASRWYRAGQSGEVTATGRSRNPMVWLARAWDRGYARLERGYARLLHFAIGSRTRWLVVAAGVLAFVGGVSLVALGVISTEFMPPVDNGELTVSLKMPAGSSLDVTNQAAQTVEERIMKWPEVKNVFSSVGVSQGTSGLGSGEARYATMDVVLVDRSKRSRTPDELAAQARGLATGIPGATVSAASVGLVGTGGNGLQVRIQGPDATVLSSLAGKVAGAMRAVPGAANVDDGGVTGQPELQVNVDRVRAADLGLTPGQVTSVLRAGLAGSTVSTFRPAGTQGWDITVILDPAERKTVDQLQQIPIVAPTGAAVTLGEVAQITQQTGPTVINRYNRQRTVTVTADVNGRSVGDAAKDLQMGLDKIAVPDGYTVAQGGAAQQQSDTFGQIFQALGLSVLLMYMLMVALFESLLFPFIVMLSLPLAGVGAFGLLALTGNTLNMMSMIGLILLTGLVGKNAILLVDYTNTLRGRGLARNEALLEAGPARLRPILMTTASLVLAMTPLALKLDAGSEWRAPLAVTVIGGLLTSTLLTLVLIPASYTIMDDLQGVVRRVPGRVRRLARRGERREGIPAEEPLPPVRKPALPGEQPLPRPVPVGGASD